MDISWVAVIDQFHLNISFYWKQVPPKNLHHKLQIGFASE